MFEKLTPRMDKVIRLSQRIARDYEQDYVGTEHLLLAILEEGTGLGTAILRENGVDIARAKAVIDQLVRASLEDTWVFGRLPGSPHFRNVMASAIEEARQLESKVVCAEHLLIALAREEGSVAHAALAEMGVRAGTVRSAITRRLEAGEDLCDSDAKDNR
ncbi:MAG: Clp protease N-terminal domain-containing protein [Phycisphaerae bacterium]